MSKHIPNIITFARIILLPVMMGLYIAGFTIAAISVFIVAAVTDFLDGWIARRWKLVSDLGKLLDPIADKMLFYSGLILVALSGVLPLWASCTVFFIMLLRDFAVDCLRMLAATKGVVLAANWFGKVKTIVSLIAVPYLMFMSMYSQEIFNIVGYVLIGLATVLCLLSGIIYFAGNGNAFKPNQN